MKLRNQPLAERRLEARELADEIRQHKRGCLGCRPRRPCERAQYLAAELARARADIAGWFAPGEDQEKLF